MANHKEKNNVDYFPFICKEGKAMYYIENKHGNDGFATWMKILRQLAVTNFHHLDLSDQTEVMFLSAKCKVSEDTLLEIIGDLVKLGEFDSKLWDEYRVVWSQKFIDNIQDAYRKRSNECVTYDEILRSIEAKRRSIEPIGRSEGGTIRHIIVENIIVENTIEKEGENPTGFSHTPGECDKEIFELHPTERAAAFKAESFPETLPVQEQEKEKVAPKRKRTQAEILKNVVLPWDSEEFVRIWGIWLDYRTKRKKPYVDEVSMQAALKQLSQYDEQIAIWAIEDSIAQGWQGIFPDKQTYHDRLRKQKPSVASNGGDLNRLRAKIQERLGIS